MKDEKKKLMTGTIRIYAIVVLVIIGFAILSQFVGIIGQALYAIVAALFYFVPNKFIEKEQGTFEEYGLVFGDWKKGIIWGVGATLITLPFFVIGMWIWEVKIRHQGLDFSWDRYRQWDATLEGRPKNLGTETGIWIWSHDDVLNIRMRNKNMPNHRMILRSSAPFKIASSGSIDTKKIKGHAWAIALTHQDSRGEVKISGAEDLRIQVEAIGKTDKSWPMFSGPSATKIESFEESRNYYWLLLWAATQFLLVAFPEEYFYRGFLQTRFSRFFSGKKEKEKEEKKTGSEKKESSKNAVVRLIRSVLSPPILLTSLLFALGHLFVPVGGVLLVSRMSVFFPSLIFGWLRERTDSILAPVIYHACSNLMVLVTALHFV